MACEAPVKHPNAAGRYAGKLQVIRPTFCLVQGCAQSVQTMRSPLEAVHTETKFVIDWSRVNTCLESSRSASDRICSQQGPFRSKTTATRSIWKPCGTKGLRYAASHRITCRSTPQKLLPYLVSREHVASRVKASTVGSFQHISQ